MQKEYKYDVAFSFSFDDQQLAIHLNDHIQKTFKTFIYTDKQNELAARDGEVKFNEVFHDQSRLVVILYNDKWGETPFTRIEKNAIRNRAFEEGYDFSILVPLRESKPPKWFPKPRLYLDLEKYDVKTLAAVIESKIHELGGVSSEESIEDYAQRLKRENDFKRKLQLYYDSTEGVSDALQEFKLVQTLFGEHWKKIQNLGIGIPLSGTHLENGPAGGVIEVTSNGLKLRFELRIIRSNTLKEHYCDLIIYTPPSMWGDNRTHIIKKTRYSYILNEIEQPRWHDNESSLTNDMLIDFWIKQFLEMAKSRSN